MPCRAGEVRRRAFLTCRHRDSNPVTSLTRRSPSYWAFMRTQLISCRLPKVDSSSITVVALSPPVPYRLFFVR